MYPLRVDLLLVSLWPSGQTTHVIDLAEALVALGHRPRALLTHAAEAGPHHETYAARLEAAGVPVVAASREAAVMGAVCAASPDVIHVHDARLFGLGLAVRGRCGRPVVATCHGLGLGVPPFAEQLRRFDACLAIGPHVAAELAAVGVKAQVLPNAVDLDAFRPAAKGPHIVITYCGRIDQSKRVGIASLAAAIDRLPDDVRFQVTANARVPARRAVHLGWVSNPAVVLAKSDIVIGTERAVREGMAAGNACVVLGKGYGGIVDPRVLGPGEAQQWSGIVGVGEPDAERIYGDLAGLCADVPRLRALQRAGRLYAEAHFGRGPWAERTVAVYRGLCGSPGD